MVNPLSTDGDGKRFRFRLTLAAPEQAPRDLAGLHRDLHVFLAERDVSLREANALRVALEELLTNLAKFAASDAAPVTAEGEVIIAAESIRLVIIDDGKPFDPSSVPPPPNYDNPGEMPIGGLGLHMLFQLFEGFLYAREAGRNRGEWILARGEGIDSRQ